MVWFRVDDGFYDHPKVLAAGNAAVGLWVRCGSWSSAKGTDGRIPLDTVRRMGRRDEINRATQARLWVPYDSEIIIPDFLLYNPSKIDTDRRRAVDAERKRRARENVERDPVNGQWFPRSEP
jgi:hypothetical protein